MTTLELILTQVDANGGAIRYLTLDEDFMYFERGWGVGAIGWERKYRFSTTTYTTLYTPPNGLMACWQTAFWEKNQCIYTWGEEGSDGGAFQNAVARKIDLSDDSITSHFKTGTRDANELIGGCIVEFGDDIYFIMGERCRGGVGGGSWDNGGGLWKVPLATFTTDGDWNRVYETPNPGRGWGYLVYFKGKVYGSQYLSGQNSLIVRADPSDLTTWTTLETDGTTNRICGLDVEGETIAYAYHGGDGDIHVKYSTDGITFTDIDTGIATPSNVIGVMYPDSIVVLHGKYIVLLITDAPALTTHIYVLEPATERLLDLGYISGLAGNYTKVGRNSLWFKANYVGGVQRYDWYKIVFDETTSITLTSSAESESVGNPITLTATLTRNGAAFSNKVVNFYRCNYAKGMGGAGTKIGAAPTNAIGQASITYTMEAAPDNKVWFRAEFDG